MHPKTSISTRNSHDESQLKGSKVTLLVLILLVGTAAVLTRTRSVSDEVEYVRRSLLVQDLPQLDTTYRADTSVQKAKSPGKYVPFSCGKLLEDLKTNPEIQKLNPNLSSFHARMTVTDPPFYISLHYKEFDKTRWTIMERGFYYERALTTAFYEVLNSSPRGARVLDVGGNIGFFSLVSASAGATVDTFEPNLKNRMRYCESLNMNRWFATEFDPPVPGSETGPKTNLYAYGVGHEDGVFIFQEDINPGEGSLVKTKVAHDHPQALNVLTLDSFARERGWFESMPHIAILKVDVEGLEPAVFEGAKELLRSGIIRNIFMEISVRTASEREENMTMLEFLAGSAGYKVFKVGGWMGPTREVDWANSDDVVENILVEADKEAAKQLNLWWKL